METIYIVAMKERGDDEMSIWAAPFTSREKAEAFVAKAKQRLAQYGVENEWQIDIDSGELDDDQYLDWIDARYDDNFDGSVADSDSFVYFMLRRPPGPGTFPGTPVEIKDFMQRVYCQEIEREAWAMLVYAEPLTEDEIWEYELQPINRT